MTAGLRPTRVVLASKSPARLTVLRAAGIDPLVRVSGVDEDAVAAALPAGASSDAVVAALAEAKASVVVQGASDRSDDELAAALDDAVVIGCDSMLSIGGALVGKPADAETAKRRWTAMAGNTGELLTGHCVVRVRSGAVVASSAAVSTTTVHFGRPTTAEIDAYVATGEPLAVAGAFTLDGLGGWFVDRIDGDPSSVIGIGLPLVRRLLADVGLSIADLWAANPLA